jgi:hypothetical protein
LGQTASVTATSNIPGGVFTWNPGNSTGPTLTASPSTTTSWTVSYSAATGCAASAQTVTVTVNGIPTLTIPNDTVCVGQTATLNATPSIPGGTQEDKQHHPLPVRQIRPQLTTSFTLHLQVAWVQVHRPPW